MHVGNHGLGTAMDGFGESCLVCCFCLSRGLEWKLSGALGVCNHGLADRRLATSLDESGLRCAALRCTAGDRTRVHAREKVVRK
jgi:hypothetical protein